MTSSPAAVQKGAGGATGPVSMHLWDIWYQEREGEDGWKGQWGSETERDGHKYPARGGGWHLANGNQVKAHFIKGHLPKSGTYHLKSQNSTPTEMRGGAFYLEFGVFAPHSLGLLFSKGGIERVSASSHQHWARATLQRFATTYQHSWRELFWSGVCVSGDRQATKTPRNNYPHVRVSI